MVVGFGYFASSRFQPAPDSFSPDAETKSDSLPSPLAQDSGRYAFSPSASAEPSSLLPDSAGVDENFTSPDLRFFDLHGRVRSVILKSQFTEKVVWFTRDGAVEKYTSNGRKVKIARRTTAGYIARESVSDYYIDYTWNADSLVTSSLNSHRHACQYAYNSDGHLSEMTTKAQESQYTYTDSDKYHNWTARTVSVRNGSEHITCQEIRRIDYYHE